MRVTIAHNNNKNTLEVAKKLKKLLQEKTWFLMQNILM